MKTTKITALAALLVMTGCGGTVRKLQQDHPEIVEAAKEKAKDVVTKEVKKYVDRYLKPTTKQQDLEGAVTFAFDSYELSEAGKKQVDAWAAWLKAHGDDSEILVIGHTDPIGAPEYNELLGKMRADVVAKYLWKNHKIHFTRITSVSVGAQAQRDGGSAANRYVEAVGAEFVYEAIK